MAKQGFSLSKTAMWILMGLLFVGLAGFGATNLNGNIRTIGSVGDKPISVDIYGRQLQQEIAAISAQTGQPLPFSQAQEIGLDRAVLQRLVQTRALDHEATEIGLSIGDENLRNRILEIAAFRGVDGSFDRDGYRFMLEQNGMSEGEFETTLREEVSRTLMQGAVISGVQMPRAYASTLVKYVAEERSFTWTLLGPENLAEPLADPSPETLRAHYDANIEDFTLPETKQITYAVLSPDALLDEVEVDEDALRDAFQQRNAEFNQPERRLVERLVYLDQGAAEQALASMEVGNSFESLVEERGLTLSDIDLGDVSENELGAAGAPVFEAEVGTVIGPVQSDLGPALFRVNAVLPAQVTTFEEARAQLQPELARDRALRLVEGQAQTYDDMLAGGATLEDLAAETDMALGQIDWVAGSTDDVAAYEAFRQAAEALTIEDFPQIDQLDDGGLFAMRLDAILPPRPAPFEDIAADVRAHWEAEQTEAELLAQSQPMLDQLGEGASFADLGLDAVAEENLTRNAFVPGTPAGFMTAVFEMEPGDARAIEADGSVALVRLDGITDAGTNADANALADQLVEQVSQSLAQDLFNIFSADVTRRAVPQVDPRAVQAVHVNFP